MIEVPKMYRYIHYKLHWALLLLTSTSIYVCISVHIHAGFAWCLTPIAQSWFWFCLCLLALNFSDPRWAPLSEHISTQTSTGYGRFVLINRVWHVHYFWTYPSTGVLYMPFSGCCLRARLTGILLCYLFLLTWPPLFPVFLLALASLSAFMLAYC